MRRLSASKFGLASRCSYWLRDDAPEGDDKPGSSARLGNALHRYAEHMGERSLVDCAIEFRLNGSQRKDLAAMVAQWERGFKPWIRADALREVRLGWDPDKDEAHELPTTDDNGEPLPAREYRAPGHWVTGTADLVQHDGGGVWFVDDYKTGLSVEGSEESWQLLVLSVLVALRFGAVTVAARNIKVRPDALIPLPPAVRESGGLTEAHEKMRRVYLSAGKHAAAMPGRHCKSGYCPLRDSCGAHREWLAEARKGPRHRRGGELW